MPKPFWSRRYWVKKHRRRLAGEDKGRKLRASGLLWRTLALELDRSARALARGGREGSSGGFLKGRVSMDEGSD